jgi:hypothetical protein
VKTFLTPDVAESGGPLLVVHDTDEIYAFTEYDEVWFDFKAVCGSNEHTKSINPNGHSQRDRSLNKGTLVSCPECRAARK